MSYLPHKGFIGLAPAVNSNQETFLAGFTQKIDGDYDKKFHVYIE
jgi:hypothetical protein